MIKRMAESLSVDRFTVDFLLEENSGTVIESLIECLMRHLAEEQHKPDSDRFKWICKYFDSMFKFVAENLQEFLTDHQGNHLLLKIIEAMGGMKIGRHWSRQTMKFGCGKSACAIG